jgi:hypothetical protein
MKSKKLKSDAKKPTGSKVKKQKKSISQEKLDSQRKDGTIERTKKCFRQALIRLGLTTTTHLRHVSLVVIA